MNCTKHRRPNCTASPECRRERDRRASATTDTASDLSNPVSPLHQATYGGSFYGSSSSSDCGSSSSSSYSSSSDSGSSSSSSCD